MGKKETSTAPSQALWIYGIHACIKALKNPQRRILRLVCVDSHQAPITSLLAENHIDLDALSLQIEPMNISTLTSLLPKDAVHQKIALCAKKLPVPPLETYLKNLNGPGTFLCLDQITDPHNVGAILRSCAAFDIDGICLTERHSPELTGILAKAASGALENLSLFMINNLSQTLETFKKHEFWCLGLAEEGTHLLGNYDIPERVVFILGSEGKGLRPLTRKNCDILLNIPTSPEFPTLNVSVAAGICLYENARHKTNTQET